MGLTISRHVLFGDTDLNSPGLAVRQVAKVGHTLYLGCHTLYLTTSRDVAQSLSQCRGVV